MNVKADLSTNDKRGDAERWPHKHGHCLSARRLPSNFHKLSTRREQPGGVMGASSLRREDRLALWLVGRGEDREGWWVWVWVCWGGGGRGGLEEGAWGGGGGGREGGIGSPRTRQRVVLWRYIMSTGLRCSSPWRFQSCSRECTSVAPAGVLL